MEKRKGIGKIKKDRKETREDGKIN